MKKLKRDDEKDFPASAEMHTPSRRDDTLLTVCFSLRAESSRVTGNCTLTGFGTLLGFSLMPQSLNDGIFEPLNDGIISLLNI
jgi:hypothetical protein